MDNKPGIKYLVQINSLAKLFNDVIKLNDYNAAYNFIYKMRIIHGSLLVESNSFNKVDDETYFKLSCMNSVLLIINNKIIESETLFNKIITDKNVDTSTLNIIKTDPSNNLPLFDGIKSDKSIIEDEMKIIGMNEFNENIPSLLFFYNPQCPACVKTKPHWIEITNDIKEMFKKDIVLFNIMEFNLAESANEKLARLFKIEYIPTIIMMESSSKSKAMIERSEGYADKQKIQKFIKESFDKFINN
jgi:thiol-disulfide isomerase/thioredoxin